MAGADEHLADLAFQYGRNVGLAFQLVDDLLDFVSSAEAMGKPTAADLKLGLATAPVLFACEKVRSIVIDEMWSLSPDRCHRVPVVGYAHKHTRVFHKRQKQSMTGIT